MTEEIKNGTRTELQNYIFLSNFFIYTGVLYSFIETGGKGSFWSNSSSSRSVTLKKKE